MKSKKKKTETSLPATILKIYPANDLIFDYEIDTNEIVEEVKKQWKKFQVEDLKMLSETLEKVLQENNGETLTIDRKKDEDYFNKTVSEANSFYQDANAGRIPPIPDFYVTNSDQFTISILLADTPVRLSTKDLKAFRVFFAFKLATIEVELLDEFIDYVYKRHFQKDYPTYETFMAQVFSEHGSVIKARKFQIGQNIYKQKEDYESLQKGTFQNETVETDNEVLSKEDDIVGITERRRVIAMKYLLEYINSQYPDFELGVNAKARFIRFIFGKTEEKDMSNENYYKFLKSPFVSNHTRNIRNLQFVKSHFEKLGFKDIIELIEKDIKQH